MRERLLTRLGTTLPLIQAPMAGVQKSRLAIAVSKTGALGSLPAALLTPEQLQAELSALRQIAPLPYNVNFFCHRDEPVDPIQDARWREALAPHYMAQGLPAPGPSASGGRAPFNHIVADLVEPFRPPVVSFHFGLPAPDLLARVKSWGSAILSSATTVEEARWLEAHGVDAVIAQGLEAGGHRGMFLTEDLNTQRGLIALLPDIVQAVSVPVIAAGGVASPQAVQAAFAMGAAAVQVGTAFLLCDEAETSALHRQALASDLAQTTVLTNVFTGRPARGMVNHVVQALGPISPLAPTFPNATAALAGLRAHAEAQGRWDCTPLWAGQNVSGCRGIRAADQVSWLLNTV